MRFGEIEYTKPGTYKYTITESGTVAGVSNDTNSYEVTVEEIGRATWRERA